MNIKRVHISFSARETSAWMTQFLLNYYKCTWNPKLFLHVGVDPETGQTVHLVITFANTGQENEETLLFAKQCNEFFGFNTVWLEAVPRFMVNRKVALVSDFLENIFKINWFGNRLGTKHKIVDFASANRDGKVYESVIARYGIPNNKNQFCTRELKLRPMTSYLRSIGWKSGTYFTAIGIRADEMDRINEDHVKLKLFYPAISLRAMTKPKVNFFWSSQTFRLKLKGYQGNCKWCFKKHKGKLLTLAKETPEIFQFPMKMEEKYGEYITPNRLQHLIKEGKDVPKEGGRNYTFFRENLSAKDILEQSESFDGFIEDDSIEYDSESCEILTVVTKIFKNE